MNRNVQYRVAWPPFTKSIIALAAGFFALWLLPILVEPLGSFVAHHLVLSTENVVADNEVWSLLTYGLFHHDFFGVFFTAFALWIFGAELQSRWGNTKWWLTQLGAVALGGVLTFVGLLAFESSIAVQGYHAAVMALVTAYCWLWWRRPLYFFFFEMTGRTMLLFFLGLSVVMSLVSGYWPMIALNVAGVAVGFIASGRSLHPSDLRVRFRNWRLRRNLKVVPKTPETKPNGKKKSNGLHLN